MKIYDKNKFWLSITIYGIPAILSIFMLIREKGTSLIWWIQLILWACCLAQNLIDSLKNKHIDNTGHKILTEKELLKTRFGKYEPLVRFGWLLPFLLSIILIKDAPAISIFLLFLVLVYAFWLNKMISKDKDNSES